MTFVGGGDNGHEDVLGGSLNAANFRWRKKSTKLCVWIADAPGYGEIWETRPDNLDDRNAITDALFKLKCKIGVDAALFLKTNEEPGDVDKYAQAMKVNARWEKERLSLLCVWFFNMIYDINTWHEYFFFP